MLGDIVIVGLLIIITAFFTLSDMSIIASKKNRIQALADDGNSKAKKILHLVNDPTKAIATTQVGLTIVTLVEGAYVEGAMAAKFEPYFQNIPLITNYVHETTSICVFAVVTFLLILFGDILPKKLALIYPEPIAIALAKLTLFGIIIFSPIVNGFAFLSNLILTSCGLHTIKQEDISENDIETMFEAGAQSGLLVKAEKDLLDNVWRLDESRVGSLMTPRSDIVYVDITDNAITNLDKILQYHSQYLLVCKDGLDNVLGIGTANTWIKEIVEQIRNGNSRPKINWTKDLKPVHAIPNTLTLIEILESFRTHKTHTALVYNEFGHVEGIITVDDIMSAVVGDMGMESEEDTLIHQDKSGKWLIDGLAPINDVKDALNLDDSFDENSGVYQTAAGFVISVIGKTKGRLPKVFDKFDFEGYSFEVVDIDKTNGYRVDQIMVKRVEEEEITETSTNTKE